MGVTGIQLGRYFGDVVDRSRTPGIAARAAALALSEPLVAYHVSNGHGLFLCDDRHADRTWFGTFDNPFACRWWNPAQAARYANLGNAIRVSIDGRLV